MGLLNRFACLALCAAACAHAPPPPLPNAPVWPAAPQPPMMRWRGAFPDERFEPPRPSLFTRVLDAILGIETGQLPAQLLQRPFGLAPLDHGFAVADPDARSVLKVNWRGGVYEPVVCADRPWQMPIAVTSAPGGDLYVADAAAGVVVRVRADGGCQAIGAGTLERPTGVAFSAGSLYVVDPPRHQLVAFEPDGRERYRFGHRGDDRQGLNFPTGLAAAEDGSLLVVDALNFRVVHLSRDGAWLGEFGRAGDGEGAFGRPKAIATDALGRLYVADAQHDVVVVFSEDTSFLVALGGTGSGPGQLLLPSGVAVSDGLLYVADSFNHRVQIFELLGSPP